MNKVANELLKVAKELVSAYRQGEGEIKFVSGDLVRFGTRRNVWKIVNVNVNYSLYNDHKVYCGTVGHNEVGTAYEPVGWRPTSRPGIEKTGYGKMGDKVRILRPVPGSWNLTVGQEFMIGLVNELYNGVGVNTSKPLRQAEPGHLEPADAEPRDSEGRTPLEAFDAEFGGLNGVYVIDSPYHTKSQTLGRVIGYTESGTIKVELYDIEQWHGMEEYTADKRKVSKQRVYRPKLVMGHWGWWAEKYYSITPAKGNEKLTRLLD